MTNKDLEKIMGREWEDARMRFYYPQLPQPRLVSNIPNGNIDMKNLNIRISEPFIISFKEHDIKEADALNEILTHELIHFMKYPGSVLNILKLQKAAKEYVDSEKASALRTAFTEAQDNIYMVKEINHPSTVKMRTIIKPDENDSFGRLIYGLYQEVWKKDIGIKLSKEEKTLVEKLKDINYLEKKTEIDSLRRFVQILKDYKPEQKQDSGKSQQNGQGNSGQSQGNGLNIFSDNQIREGIRQFARECNNPTEFEEIVKEVLSEGQDKKEVKARKAGIQPGVDKGITLLAENFYTALAEKYSIPIKKKPLHKNGSLYPYAHESFSISDPLTELDPFSAPGILPGITKKWLRKEGEVAVNFEAVPNSILVSDNSPSMFIKEGEQKAVSPAERIYQHIVGATAISNAYLDNDAEVAVYSFGSNDHFTNFSRDKQEIHKALRRYSVDGGTTFNPQFLENILTQSEGEFDISIISDMCISNLDSFIETVLKIPKMHRIHLIYTNNDTAAKEYVDKLREEFGSQENVAILPLTYERDIQQIIMGELKKSIR